MRRPDARSGRASARTARLEYAGRDGRRESGARFPGARASERRAAARRGRRAEEPRRPTGIGELDRVLGGGLVRGGVVLLGGDPGIGKSTLLLQALSPTGGDACSALYVSGEESAQQIACAPGAWRRHRSAQSALPRSSSRRSWRCWRSAETGGRGDRFDPDRLLRSAAVRARAASRRCASAPRSSRASPRRRAPR